MKGSFSLPVLITSPIFFPVNKYLTRSNLKEEELIWANSPRRHASRHGTENLVGGCEATAGWITSTVRKQRIYRRARAGNHP